MNIGQGKGVLWASRFRWAWGPGPGTDIIIPELGRNKSETLKKPHKICVAQSLRTLLVLMIPRCTMKTICVAQPLCTPPCTTLFAQATPASDLNKT